MSHNILPHDHNLRGVCTVHDNERGWQILQGALLMMWTTGTINCNASERFGKMFATRLLVSQNRLERGTSFSEAGRHLPQKTYTYMRRTCRRTYETYMKTYIHTYVLPYLGRFPFVVAVAFVVHHVPGSLVPPLLQGFKLIVVGLSVLLELSRLFLANKTNMHTRTRTYVNERGLKAHNNNICGGKHARLWAHSARGDCARRTLAVVLVSSSDDVRKTKIMVALRAQRAES